METKQKTNYTDKTNKQKYTDKKNSKQNSFYKIHKMRRELFLPKRKIIF